MNSWCMNSQAKGPALHSQSTATLPKREADMETTLAISVKENSIPNFDRSKMFTLH